MIDEFRRLTFSMDELATAVLTYLISSRKMSDKDRLGRVALSGTADNVTVNATVHPADGGTPAEIELSSQILGAVLIAHCIKTKVPLPRRAAKSIARHGDKVALVLVIQ
jgi:hypothetical protein